MMPPLPRPALPFGACTWCAGKGAHAPHCGDVARSIDVADYMAKERHADGGGPRVVSNNTRPARECGAQGDPAPPLGVSVLAMNQRASATIPLGRDPDRIALALAAMESIQRRNSDRLMKRVMAEVDASLMRHAGIAADVARERQAHGGGPRVVPTKETP